MTPPPLSLYIHTPWCLHKCPYCDFNSHALGGDLDEAAYVEALLADLKVEAPLALGRPLQSVFIGGGTPSLFSAAAIGRLLRGVGERLEWVEDMEITLEANPGAAEAACFAGYRQAGVNRLSLGVQSFHPESLRALQRIHGPEEAYAAVEWARRAGFHRINLDLMFGLPGQSPAMAGEDLRIAIGLETEHLSYYQLTLEPNTPFHHRPPPLPNEDELWEMQEAGLSRLAAAGFRRYEISAYARAGGRCRHNLNYWRFGDYLGIGAGAHGKVTGTDGTIQRRWKRRHPVEYMRALRGGEGLQGTREVDPRERPVEFMMNVLRLIEGVEASLFEKHTGVPLERIEPTLRLLRQKGLLVEDHRRLCGTQLGIRFLDDLLTYFEVNGDI